MAQFYHKAGDTFSLNARWVDRTNNPISLLGYTIKSQVRAVNFVDTLVVTITNASLGLFTLTRAATSTVTWPVTTSQESRLFCDVQFTTGSVVASTETFQIIVLQDITQ